VTDPDPNCDECGEPLAVVRHCLTEDCCANCGEAIRWDESGFRRGLIWALRVLEKHDSPRVRGDGRECLRRQHCHCRWDEPVERNRS
jgi:hypothetical protein